ncbi:hypothetical protein [Corynebacterium sp. AOP12-C2-36]|uniref:hypothetical protein n=1 Tax=Corynebacterium sp. AOP12-C2-36 TaxID=3457723 RepID=UPI004033F14E
MTDSDQYREYLIGLADGITAVTDRDRPGTDGAEVLAVAGLIRWSGSPKSPGWTPTAPGRQILNHYRRSK